MKPWSGAALGSVVTWSRVIGGILTHAGIDGFLTNLDELYEEADIENVVWREFVMAGGKPIRTARSARRSCSRSQKRSRGSTSASPGQEPKRHNEPPSGATAEA